jgi:sensor histidine kinase YesM
MSETPQRSKAFPAATARQGQFVRRIAVATILLFWATQFGTLTTMRYLRFPEQGFQYVLPRAVVTVAGILISLAILFGQAKMRTAPLPARTLFAVGAALLGCVLHGVVNELVFASVYDSAFTLSDSILAIVDWFWFYLALSVMTLLLSYGADLADSRVRIETLRAEASAAQLAVLRYQLNPHFLFNTLNSIAALIAERQADEAERMINRLSDFLRAGLDTDPLEQVPLSDEIAQQRRYLEIERIRFPNRLLFQFDIGPGAGEALVPSLLLQPLVENVIKYAVAPSPHLVTLRIEASVRDDLLHIAVRDDGRAAAQGASGAGIGLDNVRQRLASLFGGDASFQAGAVEGGYEAVLRLPLRRAI